MMTLIIGGSGSGKSLFAENYMTALSGAESFIKKYYLATMQVCDKESKKKIEKHREQRNGKGFITIEQPIDIHKAAEKMENGAKGALLECISNLVANEMFAGAIPEKEEVVAAKIINGIAFLKEELRDFIVVSNNIFEDGGAYDSATMSYIQAMGQINEKLAAMADEVVEVVVGIPVVIKK